MLTRASAIGNKGVFRLILVLVYKYRLILAIRYLESFKLISLKEGPWKSSKYIVVLSLCFNIKSVVTSNIQEIRVLASKLVYYTFFACLEIKPYL